MPLHMYNSTLKQTFLLDEKKGSCRSFPPVFIVWAGSQLLRVVRMRERELPPCFTANAGTAKAGEWDGKPIVSGAPPPLNRDSDPCNTL